MTKYDKGRAYEYKLKKHLEELGAYVIRSAGSKGCFDLVALYPEEVQLWQVKETSLKKAYFKREIEQMRKINTNAKKFLAIWYKRKGWEFIEVE